MTKSPPFIFNEFTFEIQNLCFCVALKDKRRINKIYCYMTPIKYLLWLAESNFHSLAQILMCNSNLAQFCQC